MTTNNSTKIFLINNTTRAMYGCYEPGDNAPREIFKTLDPTIKVGDFVVVESNTRHNITIVKIIEVDIEIDIHSSIQVKWIVDKIDTQDYQKTLGQEAEAIGVLRAIELKKQREAVQNALYGDAFEQIKKLPIATPIAAAEDGDKK